MQNRGSPEAQRRRLWRAPLHALALPLAVWQIEWPGTGGGGGESKADGEGEANNRKFV